MKDTEVISESRTSPGELSDEELVPRILDGEPELFELVMRRHNQRLYRLIRSTTKNDRDAEDILQETYLRAFSHLEQFEGRSRLITWLCRIASREAFGRLSRTPAVVEWIDDQMKEDTSGLTSVSARGNPEIALQSRELRQVLQAALEALPPQLRSVFVMREIDGFSTLETADILEISPENVKVRLHRSKALLQASLERLLKPEGSLIYEFGSERCDALVRRVMQAARQSIERKLDL